MKLIVMANSGCMRLQRCFISRKSTETGAGKGHVGGARAEERSQLLWLLSGSVRRGKMLPLGASAAQAAQAAS